MKRVFVVIWLFFSTISGFGPPNLEFDFESKYLTKKNSLSTESLKCGICDEIVRATHFLWSANRTQECVAAVIEYFCEKLPIHVDNYVCSAITSEFRDEVLYVLGKVLLSPNLICGLLLHECSTSNPLFPEWSVHLPENKPKPQKLVKPKKGAPTLRVLHISDIHFDPDYKEGSEADCNEPLCCRENNESHIKRAAGKWGTLGKCDISVKTVENMFEHINKTEKFDYVLWTGDLIPHNVWGRTKSKNIQLLQRLTNMFLKYFPGKPVFAAVGNHESVPVDSFPPHSVVPEKYNIAWLYDTLAEQWTNWIVNDTQTVNVIKWRASYSVKLFEKLRIISINTQYCDKTNFWLYLNFTDPDGTLQWLVEQLTLAEKEEEKVHIIGHIPSGHTQCWNTWARNYYDIINRFEGTIRSQFFGHSHHDSFAVFYEDSDPKKRATNVMFVAPSVTTFTDLFPSYRIYTIDGNYPNSTFTVLDHENYSLNVTEASSKDKPEWKFEYRATEAFRLKSAFPRDWSNLILKLSKNPSLFRNYLRFYTRSGVDPCASKSIKKCKFEKLCEMRSGKQDPELCADLPQVKRRHRKHREQRHLLKAVRSTKRTDFKKLRSLWDVCRPKKM